MKFAVLIIAAVLSYALLCPEPARAGCGLFGGGLLRAVVGVERRQARRAARGSYGCSGAESFGCSGTQYVPVRQAPSCPSGDCPPRKSSSTSTLHFDLMVTLENPGS